MSTKTKGDILAERITKAIEGNPPMSILQSEIRLAINDYHRPWTLGRSVNGFTLGDGQEWHRNDWTEDMLPEGWRPLIEGEIRQVADEKFLLGYWQEPGGGQIGEPVVSICHWRTRRPLPPVIKPAPKLVPLGPEDVTPGSVVRYCNHNSDIGNRWLLVTAVSINGICVMASDGGGRIDYATMKERLEISRDNGKTWERCEKEAK